MHTNGCPMPVNVVRAGIQRQTQPRVPPACSNINPNDQNDLGTAGPVHRLPKDCKQAVSTLTALRRRRRSWLRHDVRQRDALKQGHCMRDLHHLLAGHANRFSCLAPVTGQRSDGHENRRISSSCAQKCRPGMCRHDAQRRSSRIRTSRCT